MKNARQTKILEIIEKYEIGTQEELIEKLKEHGIVSTQTTISRDIRQLKLVKGPTGMGTYKYVAPKSHTNNVSPIHNSALTSAVTDIVRAKNLVVVRTHSGMANAVAVCIEGLALEGIIGAVAGDDTILIVLPDDDVAIDICAALITAFEK